MQVFKPFKSNHKPSSRISRPQKSLALSQVHEIELKDVSLTKDACNQKMIALKKEIKRRECSIVSL